VFLSLDCVSDFLGVFGGEVGEDDWVHGGLAGPGVAHK
jgi:hypothetical protein